MVSQEAMAQLVSALDRARERLIGCWNEGRVFAPERSLPLVGAAATISSGVEARAGIEPACKDLQSSA